MRIQALLLLLAASITLRAQGTVRIEAGSLWPSQQITLSAGKNAQLRRCPACTPEPLPANLVLHASQNQLETGHWCGRSLYVTGIVTIAFQSARSPLTPGWPMEIRASGGLVRVIVTLPVERYVAMVVASESTDADPQEYRRALAVVARSYALAANPAHLPAGFDHCDSTHCQSLLWRRSPAADDAAQATAGEVLWYRNTLARSYFSGDCGGHSANVATLWAGRSAPYLSQHTDPYCTRKPAPEWDATLTHSEISSALAADGVTLPPHWQRLTLLRDQDGTRVTAVEPAPGFVIPEEQFRLAIGRARGWNLLRSDWYSVVEAGNELRFHGRGHGHGIGLCQRGAAEMAREGNDALSILAFYFPGTQLAEPSTGRVWRRVSQGAVELTTTTPESDSPSLPAMVAALRDAQLAAGIKPAAPVELRSFPTYASFRDAVIGTGWEQAVTLGQRVLLPPLARLGAQMQPTLRHEFVHVLLAPQTHADTPLWFREGLADLLADTAPSIHPAAKSIAQIEAALERPSNAAALLDARAAAAVRVSDLQHRYGRPQLLAWLRNGLPPELRE